MSTDDKKPAITIGSKIISVAVQKPTEASVVEVKSRPVILDELMVRPEVLHGSTYKIKAPEHILSHSLYLTINDYKINEGTKHEERRPFEIFLISKDAKSQPWMTAMTLMMSAVFRKGGDILFMIDELKSVGDPSGGYFSKKAKGIMPSLVADIGYTLEAHFKTIGLIKPDPVDEEVKQLMAEVKESFIAEGGSMEHAEVCGKCKEKAVIRKDNCPTCMSCGDSKCG